MRLNEFKYILYAYTFAKIHVVSDKCIRDRINVLYLGYLSYISAICIIYRIFVIYFGICVLYFGDLYYIWINVLPLYKCLVIG